MLFPTWNAISSFFLHAAPQWHDPTFSSDGVICFSVRPSLSLHFSPPLHFFIVIIPCWLYGKPADNGAQQKKSIMPHIRESGFGGMSGGHKTPSSQFHLLSPTTATIHTGVFFAGLFFPVRTYTQNIFFAVVKFEPISFYSTYFIPLALLTIILLLLLIFFVVHCRRNSQNMFLNILLSLSLTKTGNQRQCAFLAFFFLLCRCLHPACVTKSFVA